MVVWNDLLPSPTKLPDARSHTMVEACRWEGRPSHDVFQSLEQSPLTTPTQSTPTNQKWKNKNTVRTQVAIVGPQ